MVSKKVLVLGNLGEPEELQDEDFIEVPLELPSAINAGADAISKGMVVYASGNGEVNLAQANLLNTAFPAGLCNNSSAVPNAGTVEIITNGPIVCTTGEWDVIAGTSGGLTPGRDYFLSSTNPGQIISNTATIGVGSFVVSLGVAKDANTLIIRIGRLLKKSVNYEFIPETDQPLVGPNAPILLPSTVGQGLVNLTWHEPTDNLLGFKIKYGTSPLDLSTIETVGIPSTIPKSPITYEAESATLNGAIVVSDHVEFQNSTGDYIEWSVNADYAVNYTIDIRYAFTGAQKSLDLSVNGGSSTLIFEDSGGATTYVNLSQDVTLNAGSNTIRLSATGDGGPNVDYLNLTLKTTVYAHTVSELTGGVQYHFAAVAYSGQFVDSVNSNTISATPLSATANTDYQAWETAAEASGTITDNEKYAVSRWFSNAQDRGYFSKLLHFNSNKVGPDLATARIAMVGPVMGALDGASNSNYTQGTGFNNLDTASLDSGILSSAMPKETACAGVLVVDNRSTSGTDSILGWGASGRLHNHSGSNKGFAARWYDGGGESTITSSNGEGFVMLRNTTTNKQMYINGVIVQDEVDAPGTDGTSSTIKFCQRGDSSNSTYAKSTISFTVIGNDLTAADISNIYTDIQQFNTDLASGPPASPSSLVVTNSQGYNQINTISVDTDMWEDQTSRPVGDEWRFKVLPGLITGLTAPVFIRSNKADALIAQQDWQIVGVSAPCYILGIFYENQHNWLEQYGFVDTGLTVETSGPGQSEEADLFYKFVPAAGSVTLPSNNWDTEGLSEYGNTYSLVVTAEAISVAPAAPGILNITPGDSQISISISAIRGADSSKIYWGTDQNNLLNEIPLGSNLSTVLNGLTNGTVYHFAATATDALGNESFNSAIVSATPVAIGGGGGSTDFNLGFYPSASLTEIQTRVSNSTEPQNEAWIAQSTGYTTPNNFGHDPEYIDLSWTPLPSSSLTTATEGRMQKDWAVAVTQAQQFLFDPLGSNAATYANNTRNIINAWASTLSSYVSHPSHPPRQAMLNMSWGALKIIFAAAALRDHGPTNGYSGWLASDETNFQSWLNSLVKSVIPLRPENDTSNWCASKLGCRAAIAIYTKNHAEFEAVVGHFKFLVDGGYFVDGWTDSRTNQVTGHFDEMERDLPHAGFFLSGMFELCQLLWLQGFDSFAYGNNYFHKACEFYAETLIDNAFPSLPSYTNYKYRGNGINQSRRGDGRLNAYAGAIEGFYSHYTLGKALSMPNSETILLGPTVAGGRMRPEGMNLHSMYATLRMGGLTTDLVLPTSGAGINL